VASPWAWDTKAGKYRDSAGKYLARDQVIAMANESMSAASSVVEQLASLVSSGQLSPADFGLLARAEIKQDYITQYLLGIGGREQMTPSDWGTLGQQLRDQYGYLNGFMQEIADGKLTEAQIQARMKMYVSASREAYEKAAEKSAKKAGFTEECWTVDTSLENCADCLAYQAEGWQEIGYFPEPGSGSTQCLTNCGCYKSYRNPEDGSTY
jgi:hypothetical protein